MNQQCQSCGAYAGGEKPTAPCENCGSVICSGCKSHHQQGCDEATKKRKLGLGPTVVVTLESPTPVPAPELPAQWTPRPETVLSAPLSGLVDPAGLLDGMVLAPSALTIGDTLTQASLADTLEQSQIAAELPIPTEEEAAATRATDLESPEESLVAIVPAPPENIDLSDAAPVTETDGTELDIPF